MSCTQWHCRLLDFKKNDRVLLTIESRIWVKTLVEEAFYDASISSIAVAQVKKLPYKHPDIDLPVRYAIVSTLVSPKDLGKVSRGVPYWLIFVAVLAGLTCLILLSLLLWKLGFFKRKRPPRGQALLSKPPEAEHYGYSSYSVPAHGYTTYSNPQYRQKLL
ncbi:unnamed protein product [Soboliphyme baturini]|uniref:Integrin_alpha2 domain-containing protein n=1 Tax=Soboliphyme baturini TaxID=241478 RepID=A0A183J2P4_9BILA|nr:unnamed protein product [Soboliphyme baturini]